MSEYDLIVIGAGPGGCAAALRAAKLRLRTAVVERADSGGTCVNRGCVPTKALLHASQLFRDAREGAAMGIRAEEVRVELPELFAYKERISQTLRAGVESQLKSAGVALVRGEARITGPGTVCVTDESGVPRDYTAEHILAATGSVPVRPPIPGLELPGVVTSDEALRGGEALWRSVVLIGGGVIGVEFATFYADLGCQVTLIEGMDHLLPQLDRELGQNLALILKKQGVQVYTSAPVERVEREGDGLVVRFAAKGEALSASGKAVLCAIGRRPCWEGLFPEDFRPEAANRSIRVDGRYQTSLPGVYAIGDVSSAVQLAHVASAQGLACAEGLCGLTPSVDLSIVPSCIYCRPEIAVVGLTEAEAKAAGIPAVAGKATLFSNARTLIEDPGRCFMKVVAHRESRQILGAQLMCQHSTDIISELSAAMVNRLTVEQMLTFLRPHPTFEETLTAALEEVQSKLDR